MSNAVALTADDFLPHTNETFTVRHNGRELTLTLIQTDVFASDDARARTPFALLFQGPDEPLLPQQIHELHHTVMGTVVLFLVPTGPTANGMQYEATFN